MSWCRVVERVTFFVFLNMYVAVRCLRHFFIRACYTLRGKLNREHQISTPPWETDIQEIYAGLFRFVGEPE